MEDGHRREGPCRRHLRDRGLHADQDHGRQRPRRSPRPPRGGVRRARRRGRGRPRGGTGTQARRRGHVQHRQRARHAAPRVAGADPGRSALRRAPGGRGAAERRPHASALRQTHLHQRRRAAEGALDPRARRGAVSRFHLHHGARRDARAPGRARTCWTVGAAPPPAGRRRTPSSSTLSSAASASARARRGSRVARSAWRSCR
jgi:hypothetical protein